MTTSKKVNVAALRTAIASFLDGGYDYGGFMLNANTIWTAEAALRAKAKKVVNTTDAKAKREASSKKAAKTRAENKKREEEGKKRWDEYLARVQKNTEALKETMGPVLWTKYTAEEGRLAGNGDKEFTRLGLLQEVLGDNYKLVVAAAGLRGNFDF